MPVLPLTVLVFYNGGVKQRRLKRLGIVLVFGVAVSLFLGTYIILEGRPSAKAQALLADPMASSSLVGMEMTDEVLADEGDIKGQPQMVRITHRFSVHDNPKSIQAKAVELAKASGWEDDTSYQRQISDTYWRGERTLQKQQITINISENPTQLWIILISK